MKKLHHIGVAIGRGRRRAINSMSIRRQASHIDPALHVLIGAPERLDVATDDERPEAVFIAPSADPLALELIPNTGRTQAINSFQIRGMTCDVIRVPEGTYLLKDEEVDDNGVKWYVMVLDRSQV